jgi:hypothetical protein
MAPEPREDAMQAENVWENNFALTTRGAPPLFDVQQPHVWEAALDIAMRAPRTFHTLTTPQTFRHDDDRRIVST